MIGEMIFSLYMGIMGNKYVKDTCDLIQKLNSDGVNIVQYVNDPRFKIFNVKRFKRKEGRLDLTDPKQHRYMRESSIQESMKFMENEKEWLERAERDYGIEKEFITALLNIESYFGSNAGQHPAFNSLISCYLQIENKEMFYGYIKDLVKFAEESGITDIFEITGSYAGAVGVPQFMPTNLLKYLVDFDGDGKKDPYDVEDGIGSCANFLEKHGGRKNIKKALRAYNKWGNFVEAVNKHAEILKSRLKRKNFHRKIPSKD